MKKITALLVLLCCSAFALATPVRWTFPGTVTLSGSNNSVSGSFTFDAQTLQVSAVDIVLTTNGVPAALKTSPGAGGSLLGAVVSNTLGSPALALGYAPLTSAGGSVTINDLVAGTCTYVSPTYQVCTAVRGYLTPNITLTGTPIPPIPTLNEWAMVLLGLGMLGLVARRKGLSPLRS
jgi:hypothetical protein